jgi:hypothetical protein
MKDRKKKSLSREKAFLVYSRFDSNRVLELVFLFVPKFIVFVFAVILFPFFALFFFPILFGGGFIAGRIGDTSRVRIDFDSSGAAVAFIQKYTIDVMTLNPGHSNPPAIRVV